MKAPRTAVALLALVALGAAACGSTTKKATTGATGVPGVTTTAPASATTTTLAGVPSADAAAAALLPAAVSSKGTLTVALDATYAPDEFVDKDGKTVIGMDADLMNAIGQVLNLKMSLVNAKFDNIIPGLLSGKYDVGASSFTDTKAREKQVDFVTYFSAGEGYYVPAGSSASFDGLASLCGHKVSVESGTTEQSDATGQTKACQTAGKPAVTVLTFQDQNAANLAVSSGQAEVGFADSQVAAYIVKQSNGQFKLTGQPFSTAPYGLAIPKGGGAPGFLAAVKDLIQSGIYKQILDKWGVGTGAITSPVINGATS